MEEGLSGMSKVKICGLTEIREAEIVNQYSADYAGMVLFYPKSRRNLTIGKAKEIITVLSSNIKKVAVVVSPTVEQIKNCKEAGFDYIQIHGICTKEVLYQSELPVFLAINIGNGGIGEVMGHQKIIGYTLDGKVPGNGETFDWKLVKSFNRQGKLFMLAGGLTPENVAESIHILKPDIVDVSSGVEYKNGKGKDPEKISQFIREVRKREEIGGKERWNGIMENLAGNMYQNH